MDCRRMDEILNEHAIGSLGPAEQAAVTAHLAECTRCADAWHGQQIIASELPAVPRDGFYDTMRAQALGGAFDAAPRRSVRWLLPAAGIAAAAVLMLFVAGSLLPGLQAPVSGSPPATTAAANTPRPGAPAQLPPVVREFVAGVHYQQLATPVPTSIGAGQIEVCEFFMFSCPHCFSLEPLAEAWAEQQDDDVVFVRVPVLWDDYRRLQAQAFYTAEALGRLDDIMDAIFEDMHVRGNALASVDEIRALFARQGISPDEFDAAFTSRRVENSLRRAEELNQQYRISATPTLTVNGKYITSAAMAGSQEALFEVVDVLVGSEREVPAQLVPSPPSERLFR